VPVALASELISGPDLGGGFLFQLSRDRPPLPEGFTFHLQDAGTDAGERPAGTPSLLGFGRPALPCMYGGRECWHLPLPLAESERSRVRVAYNRTRFVIRPMLAQAAGAQRAPIEEGLRELLLRIVPALEGSGAAWQIGGSAGAFLRGARLHPKDIDLGVAPEGMGALEAALEEYLVEPTHPDPSHDGRAHGAAFVGTLKAGIRVEWWAARAELPPSSPPSEWEGEGWIERREVTTWERFSVPVSPIEFELVRLVDRGELDRLRSLGELYRSLKRDPGLLRELLQASQRPTERAAELESLLSPST
jgi:hypothetical protein